MQTRYEILRMDSAGNYRDKNWLEKEVRSGKFPEQIAANCDVSTQTVERWIEKHSITPYRDRDWLQKQISNHRPVRTIAAWCCVTEPTVKKWMRQLNIEHPGPVSTEVLQAYLEEREEILGGVFTISKKFKIKRLQERFDPPPYKIAEAVDSTPEYVRLVLSGQKQRGRSEPVSATLREQVRSRDDHCCLRCGSHGDVDLHVHHVIPGKSTEENLATLCVECHKDAHCGSFSESLAYDSPEEFWEEWLQRH